MTLISDISDMNTMYKVHFTLYYVSLMCIHVGDVKYLNKKGYVITLISNISNINIVYKVHFILYYTSLTCIHVFAHNILNIQWIFNPKMF